MSRSICYCGSFDPDFTRNKILIDGLKKNRVRVLLARVPYGSLLPIRYLKLTLEFLKIRHKVDAIVVGFSGHFDMPLAWVLGKVFGKKVMFDVFISLYNTYVFDRESVTPGSFRARFFWWVDKMSCLLADKVILDTQAHVDYFVQTFGLNPNRFAVIPVGGDDAVFKPITKSQLPNSKQGKKIVVEFHGMFTKTHGAEYFVQAAKNLESHPNLEFWLIGSTENYSLPLELFKRLKPKSMRYWPRMSLRDLAAHVAKADISIGHLGATDKANMVFSTKMYHALASRVALIAPDCSASREWLTDGKTALLVKLHDSADLQRKILALAGNARLRQTIARNGYKLHQKYFTNKKLGKRLLNVIKQTA